MSHKSKTGAKTKKSEFGAKVDKQGGEGVKESAEGDKTIEGW